MAKKTVRGETTKFAWNWSEVRANIIDISLGFVTLAIAGGLIGAFVNFFNSDISGGMLTFVFALILGAILGLTHGVFTAAVIIPIGRWLRNVLLK